MGREIIRAALLAGICACPVPGAPAGAQDRASARLMVRAANPIDLPRADETIALAWPELLRRLPALRHDRVRVLDAATGEELVSQVLDADGNGAPDSLLFQAGFWPRQVRAFLVEPAAPAAKARPRVRAKHVPERDDMAWESDRIAFRTYGQGLWKLEATHSSGIDVLSKRTRELVLDRWYAGGPDAYHTDTGEGADFFKVGPSLGGGGTAVWRDGRLHRAENFKSHRILADGPIRAVFELEYDPVDAGGVRVTERKRISIDAGRNLFRQESTFRVAGAAEVVYAVGTVKRAGLVGSTSRSQPWAWLSTWGPLDAGAGGHGNLGTGVLTERSRLLETRETDDHFLVLATARSGVPVVHYIGAGWTASREFGSVEDWWRHLDEVARRLAAPLEVTLPGRGPTAAR